MRKLFTISGLFAALLLVGCNTPAPAPVEVLLPAQSPAIRAGIIQLVAEIAPAMQITQESESVLVFEGPMGGGANFWFTNTLTGQRPVLRLRFNVTDLATHRRVTAWQAMIHQPGLGGTSESQMDSSRQRRELQGVLDFLKGRLSVN